jgi:cobalt/nickel transport system permease protein
VSHLHIPDGVLPWTLWLPGLVAAAALLGWCGWLQRSAPPTQVAFQGAIGALMLAAMALELPLGPFEYHLTLVGPAGVLLGPAAAFPVVFIVSAMLALVGHGGLTVVGWNALVLGAGAAVARPLARVLASRGNPVAAFVAATAVAQALSGALWLGVVIAGLKLVPGSRVERMGASAVPVLVTLGAPLWLAGIVVESLVAFGLARFLARVRPDLLPGGGRGANRTPDEKAAGDLPRGNAA